MASKQPSRLTKRANDAAVRVLVVVDDLSLGNLIVFTLHHGYHSQRLATTVDDAKRLIADWTPHLLIVDIDVDGRKAMTLINEAEAAANVAVIALTRRSDLRGKLDAFERGADDFIGMPFVPDDLVVRVNAVVRRTHGLALKMIPKLRIGDLEIDMLNRKVRAGTSELHLTSLEQALLYLLAAQAGNVVSREKILDALWGTDFVTESNVVDRHVRALRAKLQNDWRRPRYIETVPGSGYRFVSDGDT